MSILGQRVASHRLGGLIDGVYAIVMTILVLDIKVPSEISEMRKVNLEQFLTGQFQDIMIYMVVFIMVGYMWLVQHSQSHVIKFTDKTHLWLNILTLMFVALIPFSSALVNRFPKDGTAALFLSGNMCLVGVIMYVTWIHASRGHCLIDRDITEEQVLAESRKLLILPGFSLLSMALSFPVPIAASYALLLAPISMSFMESWWVVKRNKRAEKK